MGINVIGAPKWKRKSGAFKFSNIETNKKTDGRSQFAIIGRAIILWEAIWKRILKSMHTNQKQGQKLSIRT